MGFFHESLELWTLGIRNLKRRQFLLKGFATLSITLILNACGSKTFSAKHSTNSDFGDKHLSLEFISIPPANGQTPTGLIVCLHGFGSNAQDLASLAPFLNLPNYQFLFPNAPFPHPSVPGGRMWYDLYKPGYPGLMQGRQQLIDWLKSLENSTGVPLSRTILSGFSQGGAMTLDVGLSLPVAGLVSLSGYLHSQPQLIGTSSPPVLIAQGRQDQVVPLSAAQRARDSLTALGLTVTYQEFDMGHEVTPDVLTLVRRFVMDCLN